MVRRLGKDGGNGTVNLFVNAAIDWRQLSQCISAQAGVDERTNAFQCGDVAAACQLSRVVCRLFFTYLLKGHVNMFACLPASLARRNNIPDRIRVLFPVTISQRSLLLLLLPWYGAKTVSWLD